MMNQAVGLGHPAISVVLPAYNEEHSIVGSLEKIESYLIQRGGPWEIIVVDDGSGDATHAAALNYRARSTHLEQIRIIQNAVNRGKGYSVRRGFQESRGDTVLFSDCDLSAPIEEARKLLVPIAAGRCDGAFGSRALEESKITVHQPLFREVGGKFFNCLVRLITGLPFHDTQCGFKAFRRKCFVPVFQMQRLERFGFDVEILFLARKCGLLLKEVPIVWSHCPNTKVRFARDAFSMFLDLWRIRRNNWRGLYNCPGSHHLSKEEKS